MDIHKPKPFHGFREFLKEYGIIVLGVVTALAFEQAVEQAHWLEKAHAGREAIRQELKEAAFDAEERIVLAPCYERRLDFLRQRLHATKGVWTPQPWAYLKDKINPGSAYDIPIRPWSSEAWRGLIADGTAVHFARDEMHQFAQVYDGIDLLRTENDEEWNALPRLSVLGQSQKLSGEAIYQAEISAEDVKRRNRLIVLVANQLLSSLKADHLQPSDADWKAVRDELRQSADACIRSTPQSPPTGG
jgi:hypothetical protein